jgi:hypothetical protein
MHHLDIRDLIGGTLLIALGVFVASYAGHAYEIGVPGRMGPGFFPVGLGVILAGLGLIIMLLAFRRTVHVLQPPRLSLRALVAVPAAIAAFALLVGTAGLVPATIAVTFIAACAERSIRLRRTLLLAVSLSGLVWLIFTVGLQLNLPAFAFIE